jgi:hypothetical protein
MTSALRCLPEILRTFCRFGLEQNCSAHAPRTAPSTLSLQDTYRACPLHTETRCSVSTSLGMHHRSRQFTKYAVRGAQNSVRIYTLCTRLESCWQFTRYRKFCPRPFSYTATLRTENVSKRLREADFFARLPPRNYNQSFYRLGHGRCSDSRTHVLQNVFVIYGLTEQI